MKRLRSTIAMVAAAAMTGAIVLIPSTAQAASGSFTNPLASATPGDFAIPTVDVTYNPTAVTVTFHLRNFVGPGIGGEFFIADGPLTSGGGKLALVEGEITTGTSSTDLTLLTSATGLSGTPTTTTLTDANLALNSSAQTLTLTLPSSHIFWSGPIYVAGYVGDEGSSDGALAFAQDPSSSSSIVGFGPVQALPTPTTTTITVTSPSQVYGSTPAAVAVTVTPVAAGTVSVVEGASVIATAPVSATGTALVILPSKLSSGSHALTATFTPAVPDNFAVSTSVPFGLTVVSVAKSTKTTATLSKKTQVYKKTAAKVKVTLSHSATGKVTILDGKKKLKTVSLKKGKASYTFSKNLKKGSHKIKVVYTPTNKEAFKASTSKTVVLKVTK